MPAGRLEHFIGRRNDVVLTDDYLNPVLKEVNSDACTPWLLAKITGHTLWFGPYFTPKQSPCWECLAWWLRMHRWRQWGLPGRDEYPLRPPLAHWDATLSVGIGMLGSVLLGRPMHNLLLTFDTRTLGQIRHPVQPVPGCAACGGKTTESKPLKSFVSFVTGIVERLEVSPEPAGGLFHARAAFVHPVPATPASSVVRPAKSFGKGATSHDAEIVAIAEAIERYSAVWRGSEEIVLAKAGDIDAVPVNALAQYSADQFANRTRQTVAENSPFWVPHPLPDDAVIEWVEARSLSGLPPKLIPAAAVYFASPSGVQQPYVIPDSNGCAAGRTLEDALASALGELIERDALAIWWYNRLRRPALAFDDNELEDASFEILSGLRDDNRSVTVLDVTTDLAIPAYVVVAPKADGSDVVFAAAAHVCPRRTLHKALAEASQIAYWKNHVQPDSALANWLLHAHVRASGYEWLLPTGTVELPPRRRLPASEIVTEYVSRLGCCAIESYWVDLTRPETAVPVVRAIAPGLRHPWKRFAPGRLYEVPVQMGWRREALAEMDLNPAGCAL